MHVVSSINTHSCREFFFFNMQIFQGLLVLFSKSVEVF